MDLSSALAAGANAGTGYLAGQQLAKDNAFRNQFNALAVQGEQLQNQRQETEIKQQQAMSDAAMAAFNPSAPAGPSTPATLPGGAPSDLSQVGQQGQQQEDFGDKLDSLAQKAFSVGDLVHGNQLMTNAANYRESKYKQAQTQAATDLAEARRQQISHALVAQTLGAAQDEDEWDQAKMEVLTSPWTTPEEKRNLANLAYSPEVVDRINRAGMNSSQQAQARMKEIEFEEKKRNNDLNQARRDADSARKDAHEAAWQQHQEATKKVGATAKAPSKQDLHAAGVALKGVAPDMDEDSNDFMRAQQSIASRAQQIVASNKAITFDQAVNMAANEAEKNGEINKERTPDTRASIFGVGIPGTGKAPEDKVTFKSKGQTTDTAIPLTKDAKESDLINGHYYSYGGKTYQVQDGKLHEVR